LAFDAALFERRVTHRLWQGLGGDSLRVMEAAAARRLNNTRQIIL
jgi:hypothetical protein